MANENDLPNRSLSSIATSTSNPAIDSTLAPTSFILRRTRRIAPAQAARTPTVHVAAVKLPVATSA